MPSGARRTALVPEASLGAAFAIGAPKLSSGRSLRAANRAPRTVQTYLDALDHFERYLSEQGMPVAIEAIRREHVEAFLVHLQEAGRRPASVANRYRSLQQFFRWLVEDDEIRESPIGQASVSGKRYRVDDPGQWSSLQRPAVLPLKVGGWACFPMRPKRGNPKWTPGPCRFPDDVS